MSKITFFTICARNYLAYAVQLHASILAQYPEAEFFAFIADDSDGIPEMHLPFPTVALEALGIDNLENMKWYYNVTEFCTSLKPFAFSYLFSAGHTDLVYFDADIRVLSRLYEVEKAFDDGIDCVLTPHLLDTAPMAEIDDLRLLQLGTFNLGFCALRKSTNIDRLIAWWGLRLKTYCLIDMSAGLFVDQKFADLFPSFSESFLSLRHPGYNVAYWNYHQRPVSRIDGKLFAGKHLIRFVHFSGFDIYDRGRLTRHIVNAKRDQVGALAQLMDVYADDVLAAGHADYKAIPYSFNWHGARGGTNLHTPAPPGVDIAAAMRPLTRQRKVTLAAQEGVSWLRRGGLNRRRISHAISTVRLLGIKGSLRRLVLMRQNRSANEQQTTAWPLPSRLIGRDIHNVLVVDWGLPDPTTDAGGSFIFEIVRGLKASGSNVTVLPLDFRVFPHADIYTRIGVDVIGPQHAQSVSDYLAKVRDKFGIVLLNRAPAVQPVMDTIRSALPNAQFILNALDLHYLREERRATLAGDPALALNAAILKNQELTAFSQSDAVLLLSDVETYVAADLGQDLPVSLLPMAVAEAVRLPPDNWSSRDRVVFIGSFKHLPNVDAVSHFVGEIWPTLRAAMPALGLDLVGPDFPAELDWIRDAPNVRVHGHVATLDGVLDGALATIAPLRFGAGVKGKLLTSWSHGVPAIGSAVAVEGMPRDYGSAFYLAEEKDEYLAALSPLSKDSAAWSAASKASTAYVSRNFSAERLNASMAAITSGLARGAGPIPNCHAVSDYQGFLRHDALSRASLLKRRSLECGIATASTEVFRTKGYCSVCGSPSEFVTSYVWSVGKYDDGTPEPNWREHAACVACGLVTRLRATFHYLNTISLPERPAVYAQESVTPFFSRLAGRFEGAVGSEYLGDTYEPGQLVNGVRHENAEHLSFDDQSLDLVVSLDVLEHVADFEAAFREFFRCLRKGGQVVFTVPFYRDSATNVTRAELLPDGSLIHRLPPEYHGNPVDPDGGSLCYRYYGWELLEMCRSIGFSVAEGNSYWSERYQYLGTENWIFHLVKS